MAPPRPAIDPYSVDADTFFDALFPAPTTECKRLDALRAYWGDRIHTDVARIVVAFDAMDRVRPDHGKVTNVSAIGPWVMASDTFALPPAKDGNLFAGRLEHARVHDALAVPSWEIFTNALCIGSDGGGNLFFVPLTLDRPDACDVFLLAREDFGYAEPEHVAASVRHFVHACALAAAADGKDDPSVVPSILRSADHVNYETPTFRALGRRAHVATVPKQATPYHYFAWRGRWLWYLTKDPVDLAMAASAMAEIMEDPNAPKEDGVLTPENLADPDSPLATMVVSAAYWTFHFWFRGNDDALDAVTRVVARSPLPLVRDVAAFVTACRAKAPGTEALNEVRTAFLGANAN